MKKPNIRKPKKPGEDNEDEEEEEEVFIKVKKGEIPFVKRPEQVSTIQLGDLVVSTNQGSLKQCKSIAKEILRDRKLNNYLNSFQKKKIFGGVSYIE